ncbi:hypothetical protein DVH24_006282 [Malus domestica]|uniref:Uncharacterized protein n=1 Tax=Malus domestica TaxID=3750 RepID=A0A498KGY0_MALDO|nr:hypothetical protein DVH24_006282 [Malus domestica]
MLMLSHKFIRWTCEAYHAALSPILFKMSFGKTCVRRAEVVIEKFKDFNLLFLYILTFIGHLYKALVQNSINTFVDAEILTVPEESSYVEEMRQRHLEEMRQQEEMRQRHLEEMRQRKEMRQRGRRLEETRQRHLEAMSLRRRMEAMRQRRF